MSLRYPSSLLINHLIDHLGLPVGAHSRGIWEMEAGRPRSLGSAWSTEARERNSVLRNTSFDSPFPCYNCVYDVFAWGAHGVHMGHSAYTESREQHSGVGGFHPESQGSKLRPPGLSSKSFCLLSHSAGPQKALCKNNLVIPSEMLF